MMLLARDPVTRRLVGWWFAIALLVVAFAVGVNAAFAWRDNLQMELHTPTEEIRDDVPG